tara:strand:+ start:1353 stop:1538 length:186 start_codon:yes stop_codon:yes gene_type:complete
MHELSLAIIPRGKGLDAAGAASAKGRPVFGSSDTGSVVFTDHEGGVERVGTVSCEDEGAID